MASKLWARGAESALVYDSPMLYDLCRLVEVGGKGKGERGESDREAHRYVAKTLANYDVEVKQGCEVQLFKDLLCPLLTSTVVKPDVTVYSDDFPLVFFEVQSSPYECTIIKCIVLVTDQLRLHRLYENTPKSVTCTGFTFPKIGSETCVAKIDVTWKNFVFVYNVQFLEDPEEVASSFVKAVQTAMDNKCTCNQLQKSMGAINLSSAELTGDFGGCTQFASRESILLGSSSHFYKYPITTYGTNNLFSVFALLTKFDHVISLSHVRLQNTRLFQYARVPFDPLTLSEASCCLLSFVKEAAIAIEELHNQGFAHQDVRLPNFCFSRDFKAVLIDLDRSCNSTEVPSFRKDDVMYKRELTAAQNDWMQLGLIILWVTFHSKQSGIGYYDLKRQEVPEEYQSDHFLCSLMLGTYTKEHHLLHSHLLQNYNTKSLQSVLEDRKI